MLYRTSYNYMRYRATIQPNSDYKLCRNNFFILNIQQFRVLAKILSHTFLYFFPTLAILLSLICDLDYALITLQQWVSVCWRSLWTSSNPYPFLFIILSLFPTVFLLYNGSFNVYSEFSSLIKYYIFSGQLLSLESLTTLHLT